MTANASPTRRTPCYVTTAIPYVNARPHLGFALELLVADALARYHRLRGADVRFLTGTDENGLKNARAAQEAGVAVATLVARNAAAFRALREPLDASYDDFIRTSVDVRHRPGVETLWRACARRGDLYEREYEGLYCVGCEQFYEPRELEGGRCPEHGRVPERVAERNHFFRLSRYRERLRELIGTGRLDVTPDERRREVLAFLDGPVEDISVSRSRHRARGWGIPVPGDAEQVVYVWFDALANYVTALGYGGDDAGLERYWSGRGERLHVVGKGIARFHAVYWPAILLSAGLELPTRVLVHGYVTVDGAKLSKSAGNGVDPAALAREVGVEPLRYFLLRHLRTAEDGDFSLARLRQAYASELADQLGNLLARTVRLLERERAGIVPPGDARGAAETALRAGAEQLPGQVETAVHAYRLHDALAAAWAVLGESNRCLNRVQPWALARRPGAAARERFDDCLATVLETLRVVGWTLAPFLPGTARRLHRQIGEAHDGARWGDVTRWSRRLQGRRVRPGPALFPKG